MTESVRAKTLAAILAVCVVGVLAAAHLAGEADGRETDVAEAPMEVAVVISTAEPETVWNALRVANFAGRQGDRVGVFLMGTGVELEGIKDQQFDVYEQATSLLASGGKIMACGTCLKLRNSTGSEICPLSTMKDLYDLIKRSDRVMTF